MPPSPPTPSSRWFSRSPVVLVATYLPCSTTHARRDSMVLTPAVAPPRLPPLSATASWVIVRCQTSASIPLLSLAAPWAGACLPNALESLASTAASLPLSPMLPTASLWALHCTTRSSVWTQWHTPTAHSATTLCRAGIYRPLGASPAHQPLLRASV